MKRPLITMSAITGKPTKSDINQYLFSLKENGIDQAMLYPRSGCELEYLSDEWFDTIGHFLETAKGLDMSIWLYDDFNWPSGDAGGKVTKIPEYRLTSIITKGESIGKISNFSSHNSDLFGQKMFPNLLCADAVDYFIKCTHEEYYKRFSEYFGTVIKGMFTDEASIGYCCTNSSIPYYSGIENDYYELCSRDFTTDLTQGYELFYYYATEAVSNRFRLCYTSRIETWCASHGICMTGHAMNDFNPFYATKYNGRILKNLSCFDIPGIDEIATDFYDRSIFTLFGTAEYTASKQGHAMAELFALGPCDMSYAKKRLMLYYSACHKIDHYFLAISHLDMRGNLLICDYFSNFSADQCDFEGMRLLSSESEKCALLAKKDFCADVYVKYPYDICAKQVTEGFDSTVYNELLYQLTRHQIQWKFIDDEVVNAPVIELISQNELMLDGKIMSVNEICNILCKKPLVTDESSDIIDGIFVRKFDDGEIAVLNTSENEISCKILGNNVIIAPYGVYISSESQLAYSRKEEINCEFKINHKSAQISRLMFLNDSTEVKLTCNEAKNIKFAIRNGTEAYLDGNKIECNSNAFSLPRGMQALYKESKEISLGISNLTTLSDE